MLTPEQQGILVITELGHLWYASQDPETLGCCPECCAPCGIVQGLWQAGQLNHVVQQAPKHFWADSSWWTKDGVDKHWLRNAWHCTSRPLCDALSAEEAGLASQS